MLHKRRYDASARQRWIIAVALAVVSIATLWVGLNRGQARDLLLPGIYPDVDGEGVVQAHGGSLRHQALVPSLDIEDLVAATAGGTAAVDVTFTSGGSLISATTFSLDFDESLLTFDPTDADLDGLPDSVTLRVPGAFQGSVTYDKDNTDGELDFLIADIFPPLSPLPDGVIASVTFGVGSPASTTEAAVNCSLDPAAAFGSTSGASVPGTCSDGSVLIKVTNHPTPTPHHTPPPPVVVRPVAPSTVAQGRIFGVVVEANGMGVTDLAEAQSHLNYDPTFLTPVLEPLATLAGCRTQANDIAGDEPPPLTRAVAMTLACTPGRSGSPLTLWLIQFQAAARAVFESTNTELRVTKTVLKDSEQQTIHSVGGRTTVVIMSPAPTPGPTPTPTPTPPPPPRVGADLSVTQTASPDPVSTGESLTYTMTVVNKGPNPATGVVLTHTVQGAPLSLSQISQQTAAASCDKLGDTNTCSLGTLAHGERLIVFTSVTPQTLGIITSTANVTSDVLDPVPADNNVTVATAVLPGVRPLAPSTVLQGSTFDVVVKADDMGVADLAGAQFHLNYDRHWLTPILPATPGPDFAGCFAQANDTAGNEPPPLAHAVITALACTAGRNGAPLTLWTIRFQAAAVLEPTNTKLRVTQTVLKDSEQQTIPSVGTSASVAIAPGVCGDVAHDRVVDVGDAIFILQIIVKLIEPTSLQLILGDVSVGPTGDGVIDVGDAMLILQHITEIEEIGGCGPP